MGSEVKVYTMGSNNKIREKILMDLQLTVADNGK